MFYLVDKIEDLTLEHSLSDLRLLWNSAPKRQGRSQDTQGVLQQRPGSRNISRLLLIKENQISWVREFSAFLCMGKMQESGLMEIIPLICPSALWGQYPVLSHPVSPRVYGRRDCHILCLLIDAPSLSRIWLFETPWTVVRQAPLSMEFSRQEYWSGLPFPSPVYR